MKYIERKQKLDYLLEMIQKGRCYSLSQISGKFNISTRTVKRMIKELRDDGHNVKYCKISVKFFIEDKICPLDTANLHPNQEMENDTL